MLRWLPKPLVRLYRFITAPTAYKRKPRRPPQPIEPPTPLCGSDRKLRLDIVYDAFCEHRPPPRRLFRNPQAPRDFHSWCDEPHRTTGRKRPRCASCEHARRLYFAANAGDEQAKSALHACRATCASPPSAPSSGERGAPRSPQSASNANASVPAPSRATFMNCSSGA